MTVTSRDVLCFLLAIDALTAAIVAEQRKATIGGSSSSLRGESRRRRRIIEGGDYDEWWYSGGGGDGGDRWDKWEDKDDYPPPIESYCWPNDKPDNGSSCDQSGIVCAFDKNQVNGFYMTQCRCLPETMKWQCGNFSPLPTPPTQPPAMAPVPCSGTKNGCVISKPLCGPNIYCEDLPNNGVQEEEEEEGLDGSSSITIPDSDGGGIDFDVNSGADLPSYEETCVQHESNDGSFVCTFIARIDPLDMDSITGKNIECIFSQAMESEYCFTTKVVMDMNGDGEVTVEDLTMPDDGDGDGDGIDFDVNAATINGGSSNTESIDTIDNDNNTGDTTHDHTAVEWAGSGSGDCPTTIPTDGDECEKHVSPNSSQISCTYNNFQCRCALHNYINDLIGWSCRDNTQASGP
ncbi:hypothetical protein FRACYDRAFT_267991 [Fragilariopsis cylindrus CCMP1102]|uniref:Calmodulin n=1 Tax=Fragilariopsis cylindrus CCMP1102 TaxID=635003 RepID=A0A1E7FML3_9STRA|nr:hypothetical protein FRACYDRAFT_267991 [Fragilariopsis cylindrus CCMP1102]|eukprot:OEU19315.1 hypothetical protein FRACYDRAFT_267991 [Fragilariopsis cylindrus CCMP1102]